MSDYLDVNTVDGNGTHFLRGVELVIRGREKFKVPSENWPCPTKHCFGIPNDKYYAEVWVDGMDWQQSYWLIESINYSDPEILPLIIFEDDKNRDNFNRYDFEHLLLAIMWYRRDLLWIKQDPNGVYNDTIWPYLRKADPVDFLESTHNMELYIFAHASQKPVKFYMNNTLLPDRITRPKIVNNINVSTLE
jgi:hypothetical protein